jgi:predicted NACHT family NTPase
VAGWRSLLPGFTVLEADDLSREEIHRFIRGWHSAVIGLQEINRIEQDYPDQENRIAKARESAVKIKIAIDDYSRRLLNAIDGNARILAVATNPLLLSLICLVHLNRNILPRGRPILYGQCVEFLVDTWDRSKGFIVSPSQIPLQQKEIILRQIAYEMQLSGKGELPRNDIEAVVEKIAARNKIAVPAKELLEDIEKRSGLLVERSIDVLGFSHLTLQEYLVAKHIQMNTGLFSALAAHFDDQEWREVILLCAGLIDDASDLVRQILAEDGYEQITFAGHAIGEAQRVDQDVSQRVIDGLLGLLKETTSSLNLESVVASLAAIASDFSTGTTATVEQALSATLIEWTARRDARAAFAIGILGRARITRALPILVDMMLNDQEQRDLCIKSVVSFGNIAIESIDKPINEVRGSGIGVVDLLEPPVAAATPRPVGGN